MSLSKYLVIMTISTLLSLVIWAYVLLNINPQQTNALGLTLFYISLGLSLVGLFSLIGFGVRKLVIKKEVDFRQVYISFRQAVFISLTLIIVLILQSQRLFTWLNVLLLVVALTALESFLISKRSVE